MESLELNKLDKVNTNKYFIGIIVVLLTFGGRFLVGDLDEGHKRFIMDSVVCRRIIIFCAFFMGTRDILVSLAMTMIFSIIMNVFINNEDCVDNEDSVINKYESESENKEEIKNLIKRLNNVLDN